MAKALYFSGHMCHHHHHYHHGHQCPLVERTLIPCRKPICLLRLTQEMEQDEGRGIRRSKSSKQMCFQLSFISGLLQPAWLGISYVRDRRVRELSCLSAFLNLNFKVHPCKVGWEGSVCNRFSTLVHTVVHVHEYRVTRHFGSCTATSGISIMEFVM